MGTEIQNSNQEVYKSIEQVDNILYDIDASKKVNAERAEQLVKKFKTLVNSVEFNSNFKPNLIKIYQDELKKLLNPESKVHFTDKARTTIEQLTKGPGQSGNVLDKIEKLEKKYGSPYVNFFVDKTQGIEIEYTLENFGDLETQFNKFSGSVLKDNILSVDEAKGWVRALERAGKASEGRSYLGFVDDVAGIINVGKTNKGPHKLEPGSTEYFEKLFQKIYDCKALGMNKLPEGVIHNLKADMKTLAHEYNISLKNNLQPPTSSDKNTVKLILDENNNLRTSDNKKVILGSGMELCLLKEGEEHPTLKAIYDKMTSPGSTVQKKIGTSEAYKLSSEAQHFAEQLLTQKIRNQTKGIFEAIKIALQSRRDSNITNVTLDKIIDKKIPALFDKYGLNPADFGWANSETLINSGVKTYPEMDKEAQESAYESSLPEDCVELFVTDNKLLRTSDTKKVEVGFGFDLRLNESLAINPKLETILANITSKGSLLDETMSSAECVELLTHATFLIEDLLSYSIKNELNGIKSLLQQAITNTTSESGKEMLKTVLNERIPAMIENTGMQKVVS